MRKNIRFLGAVLVALAALFTSIFFKWWRNPESILEGRFKILQSNGFGDSMRGAFIEVKTFDIEVVGPRQPSLKVRFKRQTRDLWDDGRIVIPHVSDITWKQDPSTQHVELTWPAFGKNRRLLMQPVSRPMAALAASTPTPPSRLSPIDQIQMAEELSGAEQAVYKAKTREDIEAARTDAEKIASKWRFAEAMAAGVEQSEVEEIKPLPRPQSISPWD